MKFRHIEPGISGYFQMKYLIKSRIFQLVLITIFAVLILLLITPYKLFDDPYSAVLKDANGRLLGARIAADEQWRFPEPDSIPLKFEKALLMFEDKRFFYHPGFDPLAMLRAAIQNFRNRSVVSGGSTLTMQVVRLSRKGQRRTIGEKIIEVAYSIALEIKLSKHKILMLYASHAPYGGNVVGIEAASWRWFGSPLYDLSWAEVATLTVLPNAPSMVSLQRNRLLFEQKRNRLLSRLFDAKIIDSLTFDLAIKEPLPELPQPLPDLAPHYLEYLRSKHGDRLFISDIQIRLQKQTSNILLFNHRMLRNNQINNLAVIIRETETGKVLAYHGNVPFSFATENAHNDMVQALRSSGSILKPFLFATALQEGMIQPGSMLPDIPTWIGGFSPKNFDENYEGAIPADEALRRSLNVPFVHLLRSFGIEKFYLLLKQIGFTSFTKHAGHYGLSMILGGGEVNLWELTEVYGNMAKGMLNEEESEFPIDKGAIWLTSNVLQSLNRPETESGWNYSGRAIEIAWKTGTSFGFRDAWAIGYTPDYVIGVWAGNADGTGRPGLTGIAAAAPVLFDIAQLLDVKSKLFETPLGQLETINVCSESGFLSGINCPHTIAITGHPAGLRAKICPYHQLLRTDTTLKYRLPSDCFPDDEAVTKPWFVLPPLMEFYYEKSHVNFRPLPPLKAGCVQEEQQTMDFIYPPPGTQIYQPTDFSGKLNPLIFEVTHRDKNAVLFWHLDEKFIGTTHGSVHQMIIRSETGNHQVTVVDEEGASKSVAFKLLTRH
jgi:penicillin-binding protein 1C